MALTPEGKVKAQVKKVLEKLGAYYFMPATGGYGKSGVPDFVGCIEGKFFAIECKAGKGKLTELQEREIAAIRKEEGAVFVVNEMNLDTLYDDIARIL